MVKINHSTFETPSRISLEDVNNAYKTYDCPTKKWSKHTSASSTLNFCFMITCTGISFYWAITSFQISLIIVGYGPYSCCVATELIHYLGVC